MEFANFGLHLSVKDGIIGETKRGDNMKIVFLFGNAAVGKMTVGQELMKLTGNHLVMMKWML